VFNDSYTPHDCPIGEAPGSFCADVAGTGTAPANYGTLKLARTANLATPLGTGPCAPTSTYGTLTVGTRSDVTFEAVGNHCGSSGIASYSYQITGGSGTFATATGSGTIDVSVVASDSGTERWSGTLVLPQ
jgi:hypothetical protein